MNIEIPGWLIQGLFWTVTTTLALAAALAAACIIGQLIAQLASHRNAMWALRFLLTAKKTKRLGDYTAHQFWVLGRGLNRENPELYRQCLRAFTNNEELP